MSENGSLLTIREAVLFTGRSEGLIYRYIREGKLQVQNISDGFRTGSEQKFRTIRKLSKEELVKFFKLNGNFCSEQVQNKSSEQIQGSSEQVQNTENIKSIIESTLINYQSMLMKPLEEQALYRLGRLEELVKHLEGEKATLRQENEFLRDQIKALPGPAEEVNEILLKNRMTIQEKEEQIRKLEDEKKEQMKILPDMNEINTKLKERDNQLKNKDKTIVYIQNELKEQELKLQQIQQKSEAEFQKLDDEKKELELQQEQKMKELEAQQGQALKEQEARLRAEAEEQIKQVAEAWKKELEQARRPWWKFW